MSNEGKPKDEILLSVLEYLDRNGYKDSFDILQEKTGLRYLENIKKTIETLLKEKKLDELILFIDKCNKLNNDEKAILIKLLKIRKFIELVYNNCSDRIDQKDSLQFLRNEITPLIENSELLNSLTKILFYKDMNQLKNYIQKNLAIYEDDKFILNQVCKVKITPLEQLYNAYNRSLIKKFGIYFDKYNVVSLKGIDLSFEENSKIKLMQLSKSKKFIAISLSNLNICILEVKIEKIDNNDILNINLIKVINTKLNGKEEYNANNEINLINFSYNEKFLLVLMNNLLLNIYDINSGKIIQTINSFPKIKYCLFVQDNNNYLLSSENKIFLSNENDKENPFNEIYSYSYNIKQLLFSKIYNLIIIIPEMIRDIECINLLTKKLELNIEIKEDLFYGNISKSDEGKYLIFNLSKNYPKIFLYNLSQKKIEKKYYGHIQKEKEVRCCFGGDKDQYILSASEDFIIYLWDRNISGLPKYQFKDHLNYINGVEMLNSSTIVSVSDDETIKFWVSYDIEDVKFNKKLVNEENKEKN